jgi:hypothetical protein
MNKKPEKDRKSAVVIVRLPRATVARIDRIGRAEFEGRSATVRRALEVGLARLESKKRN